MTRSDEPWYKRLDVWTFVALTAGGLGHYLLVDKPATSALQVTRQLTEKNIKLAELNKELLQNQVLESQANTGQSRVNTQYLTKSIERMDSHAVKEADQLGVQKQKLDHVRQIDDLLDSFVPNVQVQLDPTFSRQGATVELNWRLRNLGRQTVVVSAPEVYLARVPDTSDKPAASPLSSESDFRVSGCELGHIRPEQTLTCNLQISFRADLAALPDKLEYRAVFRMRGQLLPGSQSHTLLKAHYDDATLNEKVSFYSAMNGYLTGLK